eukprot:Colp12_sorted_trinity150504_noHs@2287
MKLITHNMLQCHAKNCTKDNFPLKIEASEVAEQETEFNPEFIRRMLGRLEWKAFVSAAESLGIMGLPTEAPAESTEDEELLQLIHTALLEKQVIEGALTCNNCGHVYRVKKSIPDMRLQEDEV